jgi:low temperature requirement protein LtrA
MKRLLKPVSLHKNLEGSPKYAGAWTDILFNLTFAILIGGLSNNLDNHLNPDGLLEFGLYMIPVWWAWVGDSFYNARFFSNDAMRLLLLGFKMAIVSVMAVAIQRHSGHCEAYFLMAYAGLRILLIFDYIRSWRNLPEARPLIVRYIIGFSIALIFWISAIWASWTGLADSFLLWVPAACADLLTPLTAGRLRSEIKPNLSMLVSRFETFVLFILGGILSGIIHAISQQASILLPSISGALSFILIMGFGWLFFDVKGTRNLTPTTSEKPHFVYLKWLFSHLGLIITLTTSGIVLKHMTASADPTLMTAFDRLLLCFSVFFIMLSMGNLTTFESLLPLNRQALWHWGIKLLALLGCIALGLLNLPFNAFGTISILIVCAIVVCT